MLSTAIVISFLLTGCHCAQWSANLEEGATVYACEGQDLTLPWSITPDTGEDLMEFTWFFVDQTDQMIGRVYSHHAFLPTASYSARVKDVSNGSITLSHVKTGDAGKYKLKVTVNKTGGTLMTFIRTAVVIVASVSTARTDASVEVRQHPQAVHSQTTGEFHLQLNCTGRGYPPSAVIWKTPSQQTLLSSNRDGDTFSLLLPNPVSGGNYTCRVPLNSSTATCLPRDDPALEGATVFVDDMKARMTLLEARLTALQVENSGLKDVHSKRVIFHAGLGRPQQLSIGDRIKLGVVHVNQANAYNATTGEFTVPYSGHYYFTANVGGGDYSTRIYNYAALYIMVDGSVVSHIYTVSSDYFGMGTCSYAGHLNNGQKVWVRAWSTGYYSGDLTSFSGFLVYPD